MEHRPVFRADLAPGEECVFPGYDYGYGAGLVFDRVGIEYELPVFEEPCQARPDAEHAIPRGPRLSAAIRARSLGLRTRRPVRPSMTSSRLANPSHAVPTRGAVGCSRGRRILILIAVFSP